MYIQWYRRERERVTVNNIPKKVIYYIMLVLGSVLLPVNQQLRGSH